jgi:hypothetical protein
MQIITSTVRDAGTRAERLALTPAVATAVFFWETDYRRSWFWDTVNWICLSTNGAALAMEPVTPENTLSFVFSGVNQTKQSVVLPDNGITYTMCTASLVATGLVSDPGAWVASTAYAVAIFRRPIAANGFRYEVTAIAGTGTSSAAEPVWPKVPGATIVDNAGANQITWTCRALDDIAANAFALMTFAAQTSQQADETLGTGAALPAGYVLPVHFLNLGKNEKLWIPEGLFPDPLNRKVYVRSPFQPSAGSLSLQLNFQ